MRTIRFLSVAFAIGVLLAGCASVDHPDPIAEGLERVDKHTVVAAKSFLTSYPARNSDGTINVVVEIPAGTTAKWEVAKADGTLRWEFKDKHPRIVRYLGYPGNYGMVPRTILPKSAGGDGDPLDVIVLGPAVPRGSVIRARLIGALRVLDGGEKDDKLVAVMHGTALGGVASIAALDRRFPGITQIVETWFANYKGPGAIKTNGYADVGDASVILTRAVRAYVDGKE
jgi:inorganic pyrophosphatase